MDLNSGICPTCGLSERALRGRIAQAITADHSPIMRQTYDSSFEACACGYMGWPCQLGVRAAAIARGNMGHEDLLGRFTRPEALIPNQTIALALYAVVELHQPSPGRDDALAYHCSACSRMDLVPYPCPTIRDIERVLDLPGSRAASAEN